MPFLTRDSASPLVAIDFSLPEDFVHTVTGAIYELSLEENWEKFGYLTESECAEIMRTAFQTIQVSEPFPPLLQNSLAAHWTMNETSGSRLDSQPRHYDLSDNGGVGFEAGKLGNAATLTVTPQKYLSLADNDLTSIGNRSFSVTGWIKFATGGFSNLQAVLGKYKITADGNRDWFLRKLASGLLEWNLSADGTNFTTVTAALFGAVVANTWYFFTARHDFENELASISINKKLNAASHAGGVHDGNSDFYIGRQASTYSNMAIDSVSIFNHAITREQESWLYNDGTGRTYAEIMAYEG